MELLGKTVVQLKEMLEKKELSTKELNEYFNKRIQKYNKDLNAYLTLNEVAPEEKGEYLGIPLAVKDNFCTKGLRTTASAKVLDNFVPTYESTVTTRAKEAGFYVNGKANMDAWAHGSSTETSDYGTTHNPWDLNKVPGGSSGGSAAAVGAYLAPAALGSETAGSTRLPAAWCGLVGIKPTYGRVSRYGVVAMGSSLDSPGPLTTNVEDGALILEKIAGHDPYDATSVDAPVEKYSEKMKEGKKYTLGISEDYFNGVEDSLKIKIEEAIKVLEKLGHKVKQIKLLDPQYSISVYTIIQRAEVSSNLGRYTGIRYGNGREVFGKEAKKRIMLGTYTLAHGYYDAYYKKAQKVRTLIIEDFKNAFNDIDMVVAPTTPITALPIGESDKYPFFGEMMDVLVEPSSIAGLPGISIPVGLDKEGMPVGMQFIANYLNEGAMLDLAYQFEKETDFMGVVKQGLSKWKD